jgi:Ala-tRNA(Pro) deacylase
VPFGNHASADNVGTEGCVRPRSLDEFLKDARVPFVAFRHSPAFTAQEEAAVSHVPGRCWAKIVVCIADDVPILAVLPAHLLVDLEALRLLADACGIRLAQERELAGLYPDCELGAMPPFGDLYLQRVFVDRSLVGEANMVFNAGTHVDAIQMHYGDFAEITRPIVGTFGRLPTAASGALAAGV